MNIIQQKNDLSSDNPEGDALTYPYIVQQDCTIKTMSFNINWKDQGFGNQKGRVFLSVTRDGSAVIERHSVFGVAAHEWEEQTVLLDAAALPEISAIRGGDVVSLSYYVGGGGGHKLFIDRFTAEYTVVPVISETREVNDIQSEVPDGGVLVDPFFIPSNQSIHSMDFSIRWKDQGYGNQKGRVFLSVTRDGSAVIERHSVFGVAAHEWQEQTVLLDAAALPEISAIRGGDVVSLSYYVGGGGGHKLFIDRFTAEYTVVPVISETREVNDIQSEVPDGGVLVDPFFIPSNQSIHSMDFSIRWKDQGYGNQKGRVFLSVTRDGSAVIERHSVFGVAAHEWEDQTVELNASNLPDIANIRGGDVVELSYYVGGGGGHKLYIDSFKVNFIMEIK
eukprot:TRINITY_DN20_c0_g1_i4.p1 TRINITY_DN20_c0_g1~~TRINITY_DN20_c0_g1_i4.p1  ORF type:complete len:391 (-),score=84.26 TRINITY_DN20_c0_g1_i4:14-1186(-)